MLICLLIIQIVTYGSDNIFKIFKFAFAFSIPVTVLVNVANSNVNFVKQINI